MKHAVKSAGLAALLWPGPRLVHAPSAGGVVNAWPDGFNHPGHGWDPRLAMGAAGLWAGHPRGRLVRRSPVTFGGVMGVGGIGGVTGAKLPGSPGVVAFGLGFLGAIRG
jgi:hydrogenase/urease accessory protein HupE